MISCAQRVFKKIGIDDARAQRALRKIGRLRMRSRLNLDNDLDEPRWMELCGVSCKHVNVPEMVGFCGDGREPCRIGHRHRPLDLFSRLFAPENALTWNLPFWPMSNSG